MESKDKNGRCLPHLPKALFGALSPSHTRNRASLFHSFSSVLKSLKRHRIIIIAYGKKLVKTSGEAFCESCKNHSEILKSSSPSRLSKSDSRLYFFFFVLKAESPPSDAFQESSSLATGALLTLETKLLIAEKQAS